MACGAGAPAMVPEEWECHRSWVRAWPEGGERRTVNGSGHEHRPTGRRKSRKSVVQKAVLRRGRYARHCVLKAIAGITALSASLLYSSTQRVVRNCAWPTGRLITGTASQRPHREDGGDVHMQPNTVQHAAQSYCQVRPLIFCRRRGPQESSSRSSGSVILARSLLPACDAGLSSTLPVGMALVSGGALLARWPAGRPPPARQALRWASQPTLPGKPRQAMEENAQLNSKLNNFKEFNEKSHKLFKIVEFAVELRVFLHCLVATACGW